MASRGRRISKDELRLLHQEYGKGTSNAELAQKFGLSEKTISTRRSEWRRLVETLAHETKKQVLHLDRDAEGLRKFYETYSGMYWPDHWTLWANDYYETDRLLINVPPRHGKSKLFSVWIPMFEMCLNPDIQILLISQTEGLAKKWSNEISWHLTENVQLIADFGPFQPVGRAGWPWRPPGELMVAKRQRDVNMGDMTFQIKGRGQQILGNEADLIIVDDITNVKISRSEAEREKLSEDFHGEIMSRQTPHSKVVVVGQRVHFQDLYGELAEKRLLTVQGEPALWRHINYPAILDWETELVLWPREWPFSKLLERREDMRRKGSDALFETMYQQNPNSGDASLVQREWIDGNDTTYVGCYDKERAYREPPPPLQNDEWWERMRIISIDPSPLKYTGFVVADVDIHPDRDENRWMHKINVIEAERGKWNLRQIIAELRAALEAYWPIDHVIFEQNAAQRWFFQDLEFREIRSYYDLHVLGHTTTGKNKADEDFGIQSLGPDFEWGRIRLPGASAPDRRQVDPLVSEALEHPWGSTDDLLMALWFIRWQLRRLRPRKGIGRPKINQMPQGPANPGTMGLTYYGWEG